LSDGREGESRITLHVWLSSGVSAKETKTGMSMGAFYSILNVAETLLGGASQNSANTNSQNLRHQQSKQSNQGLSSPSKSSQPLFNTNLTPSQYLNIDNGDSVRLMSS